MFMENISRNICFQSSNITSLRFIFVCDLFTVSRSYYVIGKTIFYHKTVFKHPAALIYSS
jgi:hypothetical protein